MSAVEQLKLVAIVQIWASYVTPKNSNWQQAIPIFADTWRFQS